MQVLIACKYKQKGGDFSTKKQFYNRNFIGKLHLTLTTFP